MSLRRRKRPRLKRDRAPLRKPAAQVTRGGALLGRVRRGVLFFGSFDVCRIWVGMERDPRLTLTGDFLDDCFPLQRGGTRVGFVVHQAQPTPQEDRYYVRFEERTLTEEERLLILVATLLLDVDLFELDQRPRSPLGPF